MDVLLALGTSSAYFFSIYQWLKGSSELYFESSAMIITLVLLGKYFEARAKGKTSEAMKQLMNLRRRAKVSERCGDDHSLGRGSSRRYSGSTARGTDSR